VSISKYDVLGTAVPQPDREVLADPKDIAITRSRRSPYSRDAVDPLACLRPTTKTVEQLERWRSSRSEMLPGQRPSPSMSALALTAHDAPREASGRRYTLLKVGNGPAEVVQAFVVLPSISRVSQHAMSREGTHGNWNS